MIAPRTENKEFSEILEVLLENGLDGMPRVFGMLMNMAMKIERSRAMATLDKEPDAWRNRSLGEFPRLILDATFPAPWGEQLVFVFLVHE